MKSEEIGRQNPIQKILDRYNPIKEYKYFKKEGVKHPTWWTACCLVGRLNSNLDWIDNRVFHFLGLVKYGSTSFQCGYRIGWNPESFLKTYWRKDIWVNPKNGGHWYDADKFGEKEKALCKELRVETEKVSEHRELRLYSPWIIDSYYKYSAPDRRIVEVDEDGEEEIATHHFTGGVRRRKLLWQGYYCVKERWLDDMTKFNQDCDAYHSGGDDE